jgi:hypothetical protein
MKTKPFRSTQFTQPEKCRDGKWYFREFPPIGGDIQHGNFASRAESRAARRHLVTASVGSTAMAERDFYNASRRA